MLNTESNTNRHAAMCILLSDTVSLETVMSEGVAKTAHVVMLRFSVRLGKPVARGEDATTPPSADNCISEEQYH